MNVKVKLFAVLREKLPPESDGESVELEVQEGTTPGQIIDRLKIPRELAHLVMLDGRHLLPEEVEGRAVRAGEVLSIFPPIAGGAGARP